MDYRLAAHWAGRSADLSLRGVGHSLSDAELVAADARPRECRRQQRGMHAHHGVAVAGNRSLVVKTRYPLTKDGVVA